MKDQGSTDNWQLQEGKRDDDRWILRESEQNVSDQWSLQNAPEDEGLEWQPVEYVKPRRPAFAWILPTVIAVALLAVLGYTVYQLLPVLLRGQEPPETTAVVPTAEAGEETAPTPAGETPSTTEPEVITSTAAASPTAEETAPPPTPALVAQEFGTVTSTYGVNARVAPNTDADVIRILPQGEMLFIFSRQGDWLELFVNDTPLAEGQPLSGTIGYASAEFFEIATREITAQLVDEVLTYVGRAPTPEPAVAPTAVITTPEAGAGTELTLPTVTPTPEGAAPVTGSVTETAVGTATGTISVTVTVNAVNGVNVRRTPTTENGNVIRLLENGTILPAIARSEDGEWVQVLLPDGVTGWIAASFVQVNGDLDSLPLPETAAATPTAGGPVVSGEVITSGVEPPPPYTSVVPSGNAPAIIVMVPDGVNAREAPDIGADAITVVPQGAVLPAIARSSDSQWVQVELPTGELAWIFRDTVTATPAVGALPAVEVETPTPTPEPPTAPAATATPAAPTPAPAAATATVRQLLLAVYAEPSSDAEIIARAARGSALDVLGRNTTGDWVQVRDEEGTVGWVAVNGVTVSVDVTTLPVVP
jgi:SH3-like domain-containing protein